MIARLAAYQVPPVEVESLIDEVVAAARARSGSSMLSGDRDAEFFFVDRPNGRGLSLVLGDDKTVSAVIEIPRSSSEQPAEYEVQLLQLGGPLSSGVVENLFARVVRCSPGEAPDRPFHGGAVPTSPEVWARGVLAGMDGRVLAFAVATAHGALDEALNEFSSRCAHVDDYDEVAYHYLGGRGL
jgi:hypothetical protein